MAGNETNSATVLPDLDAITKAAQLDIFDKSGNKIKFGSTFENQKTIVVFIRHFFCGSCQAYVEGLASTPKEVLEKVQTNLVVIGCGGWEAISSYQDMTQFRGLVYADPSRSLYHALGMDIETLQRTPKNQERRSYLTKGIISNVVESIWKGPAQHPSLIGKQGNVSQLGGEFVFGPGLNCSFASRMQHTEDHVEIRDLLEKVGVDA